MKEKLTKNLGYKLLSVPLAVILWIVIINVDDPISTKTITNVPVNILNEDYITASDLVYDIEEGSSVTVTIKAKRLVRDKLKASDIQLTADLSNITLYNKVEIVAECPKFQHQIFEITTNPKMLTVSLEDRDTESKSVQVVTTGSVDSGFYVDSVEAIPNIIEITGAFSVIDKIAEVRVLVNVGGARKSFSQEGLIPKVYDKKGREIDSTRLTFSHSEIDVNVNVIPTKVVPIKIKTEGDAFLGYSVNGLEYDPNVVEIAGQPDVLSKIDSITIPIEIKGANSNMEKTIELAPYIPEGIKLVSDITTIAIRVKVEKLATREITIPVEDLDIRNLPEDYDIRVNVENGLFHFTIMGLEGDIVSVIAEDLYAYIDLSERRQGTFMVALNVDPPEGISISGNPQLSVTLLEKHPSVEVIPPEEEEEEFPEEEDGSEGEDILTEEEPIEE